MDRNVAANKKSEVHSKYDCYTHESPSYKHSNSSVITSPERSRRSLVDLAINGYKNIELTVFSSKIFFIYPSTLFRP